MVVLLEVVDNFDNALLEARLSVEGTDCRPSTSAPKLDMRGESDTI
jgi:hypothetical protein